MKRLLALVLAAAMLCCCTAMAEATQTETKVNPLFSQENFSTELPSLSYAKPDLKVGNLAPETKDTVSVNNASVIVKTSEGILLMANIPANYTCVTQDYTASIFSLIYFSDPEGLVQSLIDEGTHLLYINNLNDDWIKIVVMEPDAVSSMVGSLNTLTNERIVEYANAFSAMNGLTFNDIVTAGGNTWMRFNDQILVTVCGGHYVLAFWIGDEGDTFTEDVLADVTDVLKDLTIFS